MSPAPPPTPLDASIMRGSYRSAGRRMLAWQETPNAQAAPSEGRLHQKEVHLPCVALIVDCSRPVDTTEFDL